MSSGSRGGKARAAIRVPGELLFKDHHVEELIEEGMYDQAEAYLREMAKIAKEEGDEKRVLTYRYYYDQLKELEKDSPARP